MRRTILRIDLCICIYKYIYTVKIGAVFFVKYRITVETLWDVTVLFNSVSVRDRDRYRDREMEQIEQSWTIRMCNGLRLIDDGEKGGISSKCSFLCVQYLCHSCDVDIACVCVFFIIAALQKDSGRMLH